MIDRPTAAHSIRNLLTYIGEDPDREGLKETPIRMMTAWSELLAGYSVNPSSVFKTFEDGACDEMVVVRGIEFTSFCEHHWLPFFGHADIGYLPDRKILGLSKFARLVDVFAKRLQVQERMTMQIASALQEHLSPKGCGVIVKASHSCMMCRGVRKQQSNMITSAMQGVFREEAKVKNEFLILAGW